ncbi:MAG TPA: methyltransferase domain-containing protein [Verrucomicrobiae bacterium]|nr:methyltransferase domain-containing protein [Verrucomicrobiae bacterium]
MSSPKKHRYIHGSKAKEQRRLSNLNDLLNQACLRELALQGREIVLDVGSGLGQFTRDMARAVGADGQVIGVERDKKQMAEARRQAHAAGEPDLVEFRHGDATALPLDKREWGRFDLAHARFVLEHVRQPELVVGQMVRALRSGGRIVLADDDHQVLRLWPEPPGFAELWDVYMRAYEHLKCDAFVGRRLVSLLHAAGAKPRRSHWIFFGSCAGAPEFPAFVRNLIGVIETSREIVVGPLGFRSDRFDRALRSIHQWGRRADAAIWYALCWAEGVRP